MSDLVEAAIVAGIASILVAVISNRSIRKRVGTPNGRGSLIEMVTQLFVHAENVAQKVDYLQGVFNEHVIEDRGNFADIKQNEQHAHAIIDLRLNEIVRNQATSAERDRHVDEGH